MLPVFIYFSYPISYVLRLIHSVWFLVFLLLCVALLHLLSYYFAQLLSIEYYVVCFCVVSFYLSYFRRGLLRGSQPGPQEPQGARRPQRVAQLP